MKIKRKILYVLAVAVMVAVGIVGWTWYDVFRRPNVKLPGEGAAYLFVPHGMDYAALFDTLQARGWLIRPAGFDRVAQKEGLPGHLHSGRYKVRNGMSNTALVRAIRLHAQDPVKMVLAGNIRDLPKLAGVLQRNIEPDSLEMLHVLENDSLCASMGFTPETYMAMFLPNTYEVYWDITPLEVLKRFKREYDHFWSVERQERAAAIGLTPLEVATLASIVQEETNKADEMPRVAGVYMNRLQLGMPLQADPTVRFAVGDFTLKRILNKHIETESPYNTYKNAGLPPGPIAIPGLKAQEAVLGFEEHRYLYFCAKPDFSGYHNFASSLAGHNRNAAAYHAALNALMR